MVRFLLRRSLILLAMLAVVSAAAFALPYLGSGDPVRDLIRARTADPHIDPAAVDGLRVQLGLDRPLPVQYLAWAGRVLHGDFGASFANGSPVGASVGAALLISGILAGSALTLALVVALPLGTVAALRPGGWLDGSVTLLTQALVALPEYWLAPMGILVFALHWGVLPSAGWDGPRSAVLPVAILALRPAAYLTRVTRASMTEVLDAPYITAARARGLGTTQTLLRHGLRNGIPPVLTLLAVWLAGLLGGSVVLEVIFAIPGMGRLMFEAVVDKDLPLLQAGLICVVGLAVLVNTAVDVLTAALNPAMRPGHARP